MIFAGKTRLLSYKLIGIVSAFLFILWLLVPASALAAETATVKGSYVNLRAGPSIGTKLVGRVVQGDKLDVLTKSGDWYQVKKGSLTCWVAGWLVNVQKSPQSQGNSSASKEGTAAPASPVIPYEIEVTGDRVNIRIGPGTGFKIKGQVLRGSIKKVIGRSGDWYKVDLGGDSGWIYGPLTKVAKATAPVIPVIPVSSPDPTNSSQAVVNGSVVNIRSGPGIGYDVVSRAGQGDRLQLVDKSADWYKVKTVSGNTGWVASWLLEKDTPASGGSNVSTTVQASGGSNGSNNTAQAGSGNNGTTAVQAGSGKVVPPAQAGTVNPAQGTQVGTLKSVSGRTVGAGTTITVESDGSPIKCDVTTMSDPCRLVLDIQGLGPGSCLQNIFMNTSLVSRIRVGLYGNSPVVTRVVVDLKANVSWKKTLSPQGNKLEVSIIPRGSRTLAGSTIVIDPGHGGNDPGAIGPGGLQEKTVNMDIALKVAQILRSRGARVILTRTGDTYVDLYERPEIANKNNADLFVSIHSNANDNRDIAGTSTYYVREPLAGMEDVAGEGAELARSIQSSLVSNLKRRDWGVLKANYVVLLQTQVPAALAEVAYISNPDEEKLLGNDSFRLKAAAAIVDGIAKYLAEN